MFPFNSESSPFAVKLVALAVMASTLGITPLATQAAREDEELLVFVSLANPQPIAPRSTAVQPRSAVSTPAPAVTSAQPLFSAPAPTPVAQPRSAVSTPAPAVTSAQPLFSAPAPTPVAQPRSAVSTPAPAVTSAQPLFSAPAPTPVAQPRPAVSAPAPAATRAQPLFSAPVPAVEKTLLSAPVTMPENRFFQRTDRAPAAVTPLATASSTPMPPMTREVAAARHTPAGAPSEAEIKSLFANAVRHAIRISPRINSSRFQSEAAYDSVAEAKGQRWPQVDLTSNSKSLFFGSGTRNGGSSSDIPAVGINVATTLYDFGQTSNTIKTREDQARAAAISIAAEEENTAWELSNALIELSKQRQVITLSQDYVSRMQELTNMLSGIVAVDQGRRSELTQAKGRLLSAQSSLDTAVSKTRDTEILLHRLLGEVQPALPPAAQWNLTPPHLNSQLAKLDRHPTILKAQAEAKAALSEAAAVRSSGMPKLNWVMSKNTGEDELGRTQAFQTGLQVSWGLFRGGSNSAAERAAIARAEASRHLVDEQLRDLEQRVRGANQDANSLLERADLYQNLKVESDRIRLAFFEQWYHLGKRTLLDVLSAESDYYNNRVSEVSSRFDGYAAILRSYASSGQLNSWLKDQ